MMKQMRISITILLFGAGAIFAQSYSTYKYVASKRLNACYPANRFQGHDISPKKLLAKYPCEIRSQNDTLGAIFIYCTESPLGPNTIAFLFIQDQRDCGNALEALSQM